MKRFLFFMVLLCASQTHAELVRQGGGTLGLIGIGAEAMDAAGGFTYFIDTGTLFFQTGLPTTQLTRLDQVRLSDFSELGSAVFISTFSTIASEIQNTALIDSQGQFAYFTLGQSSTTLVKYALPGFGAEVSSITLSANAGHLSCGVIDPTTSYAYYGTDTTPAQILKINLSNLTVVSSITLASPDANLRTAVIDPIRQFAYFGSSATIGNVVKINLANFSYVGTLQFNGDGGAVSSFLDTTAGYLWFGTNDSPGRVVRIQLSTFRQIDSLTLHANENKLSSVIYDSTLRKAYFGTFTSTGVVVRVSAVAMRRDTALQLQMGEAYLASAAVDTDHYGYFGTLTNPGKIVKVDLIGGIPEIANSLATEQEVPVGQPASFFVSATGRNLTYQWNRDGAPISGATQTSYQLATTALTDDGVSFTCSVSNSSGTAVSAGTVLTIDPDIHVFPNPWRADRNGATVPVTFKGLPANSAIEIFTLAAQWVATVPESGGNATWNLKNDAGQNAASGYYLYYVKTTDDRHSLRGKFAIIR